MTTLNMKLSQQDSKIPTYSRMWVFMDSDEKNFVGSNADGVDRVDKENGKYAFLMESTSVEYVVERQCDLTQIGTLLDSKGYGIALPPSKFERFLGKKSSLKSPEYKRMKSCSMPKVMESCTLT